MTNRYLPLAAAFAFGALIVMPPALAQDDQAFEPARLILTDAAGDELEYSVGDASFYVSTIDGYDGAEDTVDFSLSLSSISPIDAELLEWSTQTAGKSKSDARTITVIGVNAGEDGEEIRYEVTDARVTSVSLTQSTYGAPSVSLSLVAGTLTVNGVQMN
jgi:hypothetical protein